MSDTIFNENAARFLSPRETHPIKEAYNASQIACGHKEHEFTRSEFFGLAKIKQLLDQPGCVGIRVHYARRWEDDNGQPTEPGKGQLKPRALLTGVDGRGRDLPVHSGGLKDDGGDGNDGALTVGDGRPCPQYCGNNN